MQETNGEPAIVPCGADRPRSGGAGSRRAPAWRRVAGAALACIGVAGAVGTGPVLAQQYPSKPIRFIVPYPPGGGTDVVARALAAKLQESGLTFVIDNRGGASEMIGTEALARAPADGYTVGLVANAFSINPALQPKMAFDSARDFLPVTLLATAPFMLAVHPAVPARSVQELVALAKSKPGTLNYASLGAGTPHQLSMEWFKHLSGANIVAVPYKGLAPGLTATMAGEVQMIFTGLTAGLSQVRAGKLRGLAVSTEKRSAAAPEYPTFVESGYPGFDVYAWYGLLVPAGTTSEIVTRLNTEFTRALDAPDVRERFRSVGVDTAPMSPAAFAQFLATDAAMWARVVKLVGAKAE